MQRSGERRGGWVGGGRASLDHGRREVAIMLDEEKEQKNRKRQTQAATEWNWASSRLCKCQ